MTNTGCTLISPDHWITIERNSQLRCCQSLTPLNLRTQAQNAFQRLGCRFHHNEEK
jgi:hypothetical protein